MRTAPKLRPILTFAACLALTACASTSHVTAFQEAPIPPAPRTLALSLDQGEKLPFGLSFDSVAAAAAHAGFTMQDDNPRYRLALTAAAGSSDAGSYLPGERPSWVARPDRSWRTRFAKGRVLRVTAVLVDAGANREVWRGTGTLRTADPRAAAPELVQQVLAKLPKS
ncbi:MAG TPA: DUF4136 domain-containing protein [Sphingomonas sp.]|uniref:DUF4136 domain-containing protein n=1 Tax=Sphingomonas sp. TaxID=28214 RepID=UPI002BEBC3E7|nr:DUF4136 domain-containing protein [Sphingomonas sp.]HMI20064.1 DUF4136 domain-containing protein [Sphingomonas sp.]